MVFTEENIKYCLLTFDKQMKDHIEGFAKEKMCISGLYQWAQLFKGDYNFPIFPLDTEEYNVIHVNITPRNIPLLDQLLPMVNRNKTKILFNVDHAVDLWSTAFPYPHQLLRSLEEGDYIFGVEPLMCSILSEALQRKVACIPHPVDIKKLSEMASHDRGQRIGISIHRYMENYVLPWFVTKNLPAGWITSAIGANVPGFQPRVQHLYPEVQPYSQFEELMKWVSKLYAVIESYTLASYGRFTVECAALGVPVIGCEIVASQKKCFPELSTKYFNAPEMQKLLAILINEPEFYTRVVRKGREECQSYSLENSRKKMLDFLNSPQ